MKRIPSFGIFMLMSFSMNAQLFVNQNGRVGIGTQATAPLSQFSINTNGGQEYTSYVQGTQYVMSCRRVGVNPDDVGMSIEGLTDMQGTYWGIGIRGTAYGEIATNLGASFGVWGIAGNAANGWNYGVFGQIKGGQNGAAIFGTSYQDESAIYMDSRYAAYFHGLTKVNGNLNVTGSINGVILGAASKSNTPSNSYTSEHHMWKSLKGLTMKSFYTDDMKHPSSISIPDDETNQVAERMEIHECVPSKIEEQISSKLHYGLSAEQLGEVFPDLVYEQEDGTKSINYVEMVPILVQAVNELSAKIETLENKEESTDKKNRQPATDNGDSEEKLLLLSLGQNKPNPFSNSTTIEVCIPEDVQKAFIYVYDLQGKKVEQIDVAARGKQNVQFTSANLTDGMYLYSLIADGKVVETRRMIVEK